MLTAKMYQRAVTYLVMIAIAVLSAYYETSMKNEMMQTKNTSSQLEVLRGESDILRSTFTKLKEESKADGDSAEQMKKHAVELQQRSDIDAVSAKNDEVAASASEDKAKKEEEEAESYQEKADADESTYQSSTKDATQMTKMADKDKKIAESTNKKCNFMNKMWGCRETEKRLAGRHAAEEYAKAEEDLRVAAAAKEDEKLQLQKVQELHNKASADAKHAADLETKATKELSRAEEEKNEAIQDEAKAQELSKKSGEEMEEATRIERQFEEKKKQANQLLNQSYLHKTTAFKHSIFGLACAMIVLIYFTLSLFLKLVVYTKSREIQNCIEANETIKLLQDELSNSKSSVPSYLSVPKGGNEDDSKGSSSEVDPLIKGSSSSNSGSSSQSQEGDAGTKSSGNQDSAHSCTSDEMDVVVLNTVSSFSKLSISKSIEEWMNCSQDEEFASFFNIDEEHSSQTCIKTRKLMAILIPYLIILFELSIAAWMIVIMSSCSANLHDLSPPFMSRFGLTVVRFLPLMAGCFIIVLVFHQILLLYLSQRPINTATGAEHSIL
mmetsp:Transcript_17346/g.25172  ORF Transcript_17346/g.25172 Transcript_17346/m.25172 type:complete len:553 (+) Transcript_17346:210-1868(+)